MSTPPPTSDAQKDADISEFLRNRIDELADGAREHYEKSGRGFWFADLSAAVLAANHGWFPRATYSDLARQGQFPADVASGLASAIADYDPRREFVLCARHSDGSSSWQVVGYAPKGWG